METILVLDAKNYDPSLSEIKRIAVRAIIFIDGKLLLIQSSFGEVNFPGGGKEENESDVDTLVRETLEETGYHIVLDSIQEFGQVEEIRMSTNEPMIWHQINRYYYCNIEDIQGVCHYTKNEMKYGFHQVLYTLDEAIKINEEMLYREGKHPWNQREYNVLKILKEKRI